MSAVGQLVDYRSPNAHGERTGVMGMIIFLGSWAMMFSGLFFVYGALRLGAPFWPPPGQPLLPLLVPGINTVLLGFSSAALHGGLVFLRRGHASRVGPMILATFALGSAFLVLQYAVGVDLYADGMTPETGPYASVFYMMAGLHGLHVIVGLVALVYLAVRAFLGMYTPARHLPLRLWAMYWHFVGVVWFLMFLADFVL